MIFEKLNIQNIMGNEKDYGYFCYINYDKKGYQKIIEGLYSIINQISLFNYCKVKSKGDNYFYPNTNIKNLYIKSRALTLEYYINYSVFFERYKVRHYPRIIYPIKSLYYELDKELLNEIEIDGAFFVENNFKIEDNDFPFIFQNFLSYNNSNILYKPDKIKFKSDLNGKEFKKNDLCLLEIKTNFPDEENTGKSFEDNLEKMLKKMFIFEQLFRELRVNYERIRLILFYDLVKKINYDDAIKKALTKFAEENAYLDYLDKICFQVIYINSSYFVESLISNTEKINIFEKELKSLREELTNRDEKIYDLQTNNNKLLKMIESKNKELESKNKEIESKNKELEKMQNSNFNLIHNLEVKLSKIEEKLNINSTLEEDNTYIENNKK